MTKKAGKNKGLSWENEERSFQVFRKKKTNLQIGNRRIGKEIKNYSCEKLVKKLTALNNNYIDQIMYRG